MTALMRTGSMTAVALWQIYVRVHAAEIFLHVAAPARHDLSQHTRGASHHLLHKLCTAAPFGTCPAGAPKGSGRLCACRFGALRPFGRSSIPDSISPRSYGGDTAQARRQAAAHRSGSRWPARRLHTRHRGSLSGAQPNLLSRGDPPQWYFRRYHRRDRHQSDPAKVSLKLIS